jgi:DNA polymerase-3 subunit delta
MESRQAFREIREGKIRPVYVIYGTESYLMNEFSERLAERVAEPDHRDMAIVRFDTAETPLDDILDEAETLPFLVPRKLVFVRDSVIFTSGKEQAKIEHRPERLAAYLQQPMDTTVLVFAVPHEKLDERKKLVKTVKAMDAAVSFSPLSAEELQQWVVRRGEKQGRRWAPEAAEELLRRAGADMQTLAAETDKLCLHAGENGTITPENVAELVASAAEQNVFKLTEELAALRTEKVLALYHDLLKQREEPIKLVSLLVRQFRNMLYVKELGRQGCSPQQMAGQLGLHPYAVKITSEQARKFSAERLAGLISELADLDYAMKTGQIDKAFGLELFLLRTASSEAS